MSDWYEAKHDRPPIFYGANRSLWWQSTSSSPFTISRFATGNYSWEVWTPVDRRPYVRGHKSQPADLPLNWEFI